MLIRIVTVQWKCSLNDNYKFVRHTLLSELDVICKLKQKTLDKFFVCLKTESPIASVENEWLIYIYLYTHNETPFVAPSKIFRYGYPIIKFSRFLVLLDVAIFFRHFLVYRGTSIFGREAGRAVFARSHLVTREGRVSHSRQHFIWLQDETWDADERENKVFPISIKFLDGAYRHSRREGGRPRSYTRARALKGSNLRWRAISSLCVRFKLNEHTLVTSRAPHPELWRLRRSKSAGRWKCRNV